MLTRKCFVPPADSRRQLVPLPDRLRGLHLRPSEGPPGAGGERWHLPWWQLRADQRSRAPLWRQRPCWHHPRLSEGKLTSLPLDGVLHTHLHHTLESIDMNHCSRVSRLITTSLWTSATSPSSTPPQWCHPGACGSCWSMSRWGAVAAGGWLAVREGRTACSHRSRLQCHSSTDGSSDSLSFFFFFLPAEGDLPSSDLHRPGGDDGDGEGEEHEAARSLHPQAVLRQRDLPPQTPQPAPTWVHTGRSWATGVWDGGGGYHTRVMRRLRGRMWVNRREIRCEVADRASQRLCSM